MAGYKAANVLRTDRAIATSVYVIRAFIHLPRSTTRIYLLFAAAIVGNCSTHERFQMRFIHSIVLVEIDCP